MFWWAVGLLILLTALLGSTAYSLFDQVKLTRGYFQEEAFSVVTDASKIYYMETGGYPVDLKGLSGVGGYEYLRSFSSDVGSGLLPGNMREPVGVVSTGVLTDSMWQYKRMSTYIIPWDNDDKDGFKLAGNNVCGGGNYMTASWCSSNQYRSFTVSDKLNYVQMIYDIKLRHIRLIDKLIAYYNVNGDFPANVSVDGDTLVSLTSFAGTVTTCGGSGGLTWSGIPMNCEDIYSFTGSPVYYKKISATEFILFNDTPIKNNLGTTLYIGTEISL